MNELVIAENDFKAIKTSLLGGANESCAVFFAYEVLRADGVRRTLAREFVFPSEDAYSRRGPFEAELNPTFVAFATKRALTLGCALVFVHSHPGSTAPQFSSVDAAGERHLADFLAHRHPEPTHISMVISEGGVCARVLGTLEYVRVTSLGPHRHVLFEPHSEGSEPNETFDRQVRAFGAVGQQSLERLRVGIVGLGGTGSIVAEQLAHLGVRNFILLDPDVLDPTNVNRVVGSSKSAVGTHKTKLAEKLIRQVATNANIKAIPGDVTSLGVARELLDTDFIFGCTDSHGSRAVLQQIAYQYLIPCVDMGTTIAVDAGRVTHVVGRVQALSPGLACFACGELLNANEVRRDLMSPFERKSDPYFLGPAEPAPSVISINGTVASLAITMFLSIVAGIPSDARYLVYNAIASTLRPVRGVPTKDCYVCSLRGAFARGESWPIQARLD